MRRLYCSLRGGLGNQLFQVAHALTLAERYSAYLLIDDGWCRGRRRAAETPRAFCLPAFQLPYRLASSRERSFLALMDIALILQKRLKLALFPIHFEGLPLSPGRLSREAVVVLHGNWQQHALIAPLRPRLRQQLRLREGLLSPAHRELAASIASDPSSVFVHVRRGDYVADARTAAAHGVCSLAYYSDALAVVSRKLHDPHLYLFSDDLAWAQQHLPLEGWRVTAVDSRHYETAELADVADFDLMRHCRHAVMANSTFSWWAAFLLQQSDSLVIAPRQWFSWGSPAELYAPDWLVL
jgi:hypothetical protein